MMIREMLCFCEKKDYLSAQPIKRRSFLAHSEKVRKRLRAKARPLIVAQHAAGERLVIDHSIVIGELHCFAQKLLDLFLVDVGGYVTQQDQTIALWGSFLTSGMGSPSVVTMTRSSSI